MSKYLLRFIASEEALSVEEARAIDINAEFLGVPRKLLMENAGRSVAEAVAKRMDVENKKIVILAGTGNKGGDGFVAARHLAIRGAKVTVVLLGSERQLTTKEARMNWKAIKNMDLSVQTLTVQDPSQLSELEDLVIGADVVVDALIGTGLRGELREPVRSAVELMNKSKGLKVAIDVPTGLNPDTGEVARGVFKAHVTITMHRAKKGFMGREEYIGELEIADIGIPLEAELYIGPGDVMSILKPRKADTHKYDYGVVLIVGGSPLYAGAPALAGMAALKAGAGLAFIASPSSASPYIKGFSPDLIVIPLRGDWVDEAAISDENLKRALDRADVVAVGPGLGFNEDTVKGLGALLEEVKRRELKVLIDADGLKALGRGGYDVEGLDLVLTPHLGEYRALMGEEVPRNLEGAIEAARKLAAKYKAVAILKGHRSVVTDGRRVKVNRTGNAGMAVGGVGDVLSGLIAGFMAQRVEAFKACVAASFINGRAGDLAANEKGYHFTASDVLFMVPYALKELEPWTSSYAEASAPFKGEVY